MTWLVDFIEQGGPVLYAILLVCVLLWSLILERLWFFRRDLRHVRDAVVNEWQARTEHSSWYARKIRETLLSQHKQISQRYLSSIAILIAVCPLLGLLGTVTGMIHVFDVLAVTGTGNARAMAAGISKATIPTMAGLFVALTGIYFRTRFQRLSDRAVEELADRLSTD